MAKVTTETINDNRIDVDVDGAGKFRAEFDDQEYIADTLKELREQLIKATKRAREQKAVDVTVLDMVSSGDRYDPFTKGIGVVHAKLRGKHERNHEYLLTSESGKKFKLRSWSSGTDGLCRRMTNEEVDEYTRLSKAVESAQKALDSYRKTLRVSPDQALAAARKVAKE